MFLELSLILLALIIFFIYLMTPDPYVKKYGSLIPGPPPLPIVGNIREVRMDNVGVLLYREHQKKYGHVIRYWLGPRLAVLLSSPEDAEVIFRDTQNLEKAYVYEFLHPWLGTGLLTSSGEKWHLRRKAITPTFHFKILEQFIDVFVKNSKVLNSCLESKANGKLFNASTVISRFTFDVICESAMGTSVKALLDHNHPYVQAIRNICSVCTDRIQYFWLHPGLLFRLFGYEKLQKQALDVIHTFARKVMEEQEANIKKSTDEKQDDEDLGIKKKTAFLELLMRMKLQKNPAFITNEDVREEVDTFTFEGHDTTASAISFALHSLGKYPEVQEKAYREVYEAYKSHDGPITIEFLNNLKYLDMVIKEALRLYASVPLAARHVKKDIDLPSGYRIPAGAIIAVAIGGLHLNEKYYPNASEFDPDRFLPENMVNKHPYSYVPFSAGPRNCIGQRYAMYMMKTCLSQILLEYKITAGEDVLPNFVLTLQSENGTQISLQKRNNTDS